MQFHRDFINFETHRISLKSDLEEPSGPVKSNKTFHKTVKATGVPKDKWNCLIDHRTKGFCSIIEGSSNFNTKHFYSDFESKFA